MFNPSAGMPAAGIVMGPVNDTTTIIRFVFAVERHSVADAQRLDSRREIDVVSNQQRSPGGQLHDESLVTTAFVVVGENLGNSAAGIDLIARAPVGTGCCDFSLGKLKVGAGIVGKLILLVAVNQPDDKYG